MSDDPARDQPLEDVTLPREPTAPGEPEAHVRAFARRLLPLLYVHTGNRCPLACPYCSVETHRLYEPPREDLEDLMTRAAGAKLGKLSFVGGEPTARADLPALVAHGQRTGFAEINLTTNGLRLAEEAYLDRLIESGLTSVQLSLHAVDPSLIGLLAGDERAGPQALRALDNLLARPGLWLFLATLVSAPTLHHLPALIETLASASQRRGEAIPVIFTGLRPVARAFRNRAELMPSPAAGASALRCALERARDLGVPASYRNVAPCLMAGWERWSADSCMQNVRMALETGETLPAQGDEAMLKREACRRCAREPACEGVHAGTFSSFSWAAFRPVPALDATSPRRERGALRAWHEQRPGRAVVVGGGGFVGAHVVRLLHESGWRVASLTRNPPACALPPGVQVVQGDRRDDATVANLLREGPDLWIDLALFTAREGEGLARAWRPGLPTRFVAVGSIAEYGALHALPMPLEESLPLTPTEAYGRGKRDAWRALAGALEAGMPLTWAVLPQVWGPGDRTWRDRAALWALAKGEDILLWERGAARLADGYVGTVAEALVHVAGCPDLVGARVHVAGPEPLSGLAYLQTAARTLRRQALVWLVPPELAPVLAASTGASARSPFPQRDVTVATRRLQGTGFVPSLGALDGVRVTALAHAEGTPPAGGDPFSLPAPLREALRHTPGVRHARIG